MVFKFKFKKFQKVVLDQLFRRIQNHQWWQQQKPNWSETCEHKEFGGYLLNITFIYEEKTRCRVFHLEHDDDTCVKWRSSSNGKCWKVTDSEWPIHMNGVERCCNSKGRITTGGFCTIDSMNESNGRKKKRTNGLEKKNSRARTKSTGIRHRRRWGEKYLKFLVKCRQLKDLH